MNRKIYLPEPMYRTLPYLALATSFIALMANTAIPISGGVGIYGAVILLKRGGHYAGF